MITRSLWLLPLIAGLGIHQSMTQEGCSETTPTPTPTPEPTPTPAPSSDKELFNQYLTALSQTSDKTTRDTLSAEFFYEIQYSGGFPIIDGNTVTFVYQGTEVGEPIRVAGDFNAWSATANPLTKAQPDYNVFYTTVTLPNPRTRSLYKFVGKSSGADLYIPDYKARRFQYDTYGQYSLIYGGNQSEKSHLERYPQMRSDIVGYDRDLWLYMPPGYDQESDAYPVIYMHDGQNLFDPAAFYGGWKADQVVDSLLTQGRMREVVIVGIANTPDRMEEYTQVEDFLPAYGGTMGGDAPLYARHIVEEVKPFIDARYRTLSSRENTAVLGSSLGGLVSYYIGWEYPEVFRYVGGMSSTFGWGSLNLDNQTIIEDVQADSKQSILYYLDSGGDDGGGCKDTDNDGVYDDNANADDNWCETWQMYSVLKAKGFTTSELKYVTSPGQEHNEASWNTRLDDVFTFWFPRN